MRESALARLILARSGPASTPAKLSLMMLQCLDKTDRLALRRRHKLSLPHDAPPANDGAGGPAYDRDSFIGGPAAARGDPAIVDDRSPFQIDDGKIGVIAHRDPSFSSDTEEARRACARHVDKAREREPLVVHMIEHHRYKRLHAGHARRTLRIGLGLLFQRVW